MPQSAVEVDRIEALVITTLVELHEQGMVELDDVEVTGSTELFGEVGLLDSVGLVSLVVAVEDKIEDELGVRVGLADERALSQKHSPYRTVAALAGYAASVLEGT